MRVVLVHGFAGFVEVPIIGQYFRGVKDHLLSKFQDLEVLAPRTDPFGTTAERARELSAAIPEDGQKAHLIAHSAGGLDARFLVANKGLKRSGSVASITTISTPHHGCIIADLMTKLSPGNLMLVPHLTHFTAIVGSFTTTFMQKFNETITDHPDVEYSSYAGITGFAKRGALDPAFAVSYPLILANEGPNDGLVSVKSAKWGTFKEELPADHVEEVGMHWSATGRVLDAVGLTAFNHLQFFESLVAGLGAQKRDN